MATTRTKRAPRTVEAPDVQMLALKQIQPSPLNPRKSFPAETMTELAASIKQHGILQPLVVRPNGKGFEIVAGERRYRAATEVGLPAVPAVVRKLEDKAALQLMVVENLQREDVPVLEQAEGYRVLHEEHGLSVKEIAEQVGKGIRTVYNMLAMVKLPDKPRSLIAAGKLSPSHAILLAQIADPEHADEAAREMAGIDGNGDDTWEGPMSFRAAKELVAREYMTQLGRAIFDPKDPDLLPEAGPCSKCPKRLSVVEKVKRGEEACRDRACWKQKTERFLANETAKLAEKHGGKANVLQSGRGRLSGQVTLDERCWSDPKGRDWRRLLGAERIKELPVTLVPSEDAGRVHEYVPEVAALKALAQRFDWADKAAKQPETRKAAEQQTRKAMAAQREQAEAELAVLVAKAEKRQPPTLWRVLALTVARQAHHEAAKAVIKRRSLQPQETPANTWEAMGKIAGSLKSEDAARAFVVECLAAEASTFGYNNAAPQYKAILKAYGVDSAAIKRDRTRQAKAAAKAKPKAKAKAKPKAKRAAKGGRKK